MNSVWKYVAMKKIIGMMLFSVILFFIGCVSSPPPDSSVPAAPQDVQYQSDDLWCRQFGIFGNDQAMYYETYKNCMERFGYKF